MRYPKTVVPTLAALAFLLLLALPAAHALNTANGSCAFANFPLAYVINTSGGDGDEFNTFVSYDGQCVTSLAAIEQQISAQLNGPPGTWSDTGTDTGAVGAVITATLTYPGPTLAGSFTLTRDRAFETLKSNGTCHNVPGQCPVAGPINPATGNMFETAVDYSTTGQNPLAFIRYYNSLFDKNSLAVSLGGGFWRTNYDRYIQITSASAVVAERADGQELNFTLVGSTWTPESDVDVSLTNSGTTWTLTDHDDTVETYTTNSGGTAALLNSIVARNGYTQTLSYNGSSQLTSVTDSYSRSLTLTYSSGLLATVTTPDSTTINYGYVIDSAGFFPLTTVTYPTSPSSTVTYTYAGPSIAPILLASITDENGHVYASWTYDNSAASSRALTSQYGSGAGLTTLTYNLSNGSATVTNALGVTDTYTFSAGFPKVTGISRAATSNTAAATRSFTYDSNGFLASATDFNGNQTNYVNDAHGDPTSITEAAGSPVARTTTIAYDSTFVHEPASIATTGLTTAFSYQTGTGNVLTRTDTDTTTTSTPYSTNGQTRVWTYTYSNFLLTSVQSPRTDVTATTSYGYGSDGALTSITDPMSHATSITSHTGGGRPLTIVDPNSVTTTLTYDPRQRLTSSSVATSSGARTTTYTIDPTGLIAKVTLPDSSYLSYTYDTAHRLTQVTNALGDYFKFTLDALGDRTQSPIYKSTNIIYRGHSATFDNLGRKLTDVGGMSQTTTFSNYDNNGNPQTITDPLSNASTQVFDTLNRLSQITDANSGVTGFTFDAHDRTTQVTDANSNPTAYVFDGFGDVIQQTSPDSGTTVFHYDGDGNLTQKVDALSVVTNQTFDKADRILTRSYPADSTQYVGFTYDKNSGLFGFGIGRLSTVSENSTGGFVNLKYDERGNLLSERRYTSGGTNLSNVFASYDAANRINGYTYPSGMFLGYGFDAAGYVTSLVIYPTGSGSHQSVGSVGHYPFGALHAVTFHNGVGESYPLDADYRMTAVTDSPTSGGSPTIRNISYGYDAADNVTGITDAILAANSQTLTFDVLNRLKTATSGTGGYGSLAWTYDKVGNLQSSTVGSTTTTYGYTSGTNRLASITQGTTTSVSTNANGNITSIPPANSATAATFAYNVTNRLASVTGTSPAPSFVYDAFGQRYSKTDSGSPTTYRYDFEGKLLEENNSGLVTDYIYSDGRLFALFTPATGAVYYVHTDRLGTPQLVTDSLQVPVWGTSYQPYGTTPPVISSIAQNQRFPGQYFDLETGFSYNLNRDYMPNLGRYLESDPIGLAGGLNPFLYASANPGKFTDKLGLASADVDRAAGTITFHMNDGSIVTRPAGNNTINPSGDPKVVDSNGPAPSGTFPVQPPIDITGKEIISYGSTFWPIGDVQNSHPADIARLRGIGLHCGRRSHESKTEGCIRMDNPDCNEMRDLLENDPLQTITIH